MAKESIIQELAKIRPPDMRQNIVDLGLVKDIQLSGSQAQIQIELPSSAAPLKERLKVICHQNLKNIDGLENVEINVSVATGGGGNGHAHRPGQQAPQKLSLPSVRNMIAVASGKGGVGKSTVTVNLAISLAKQGYRVALLDADIYGPSIPIMLNIKERPAQADGKLQPIIKYDIKVMSMGFLIDDSQPVVWRGPMVHGALTQFMTQVNWGNIDYFLIDMPPGTGDAQLTMSQTAPLTGAIIVTTPQEVSLADARKGLQMFRNVNVPILGILENMSGFIAPDGTRHAIFKSGGGKKLADEAKVDLLGEIPIEPKLTEGSDSGVPLCESEPKGKIAQTFQKAAASVVKSLERSSTKGFQPMGMDW